MKDQAAEKLQGILDRMGVEGEVVAREDDERVTLEVRGADASLVIGKHGATLDALQFLVNKMVSRGPAPGAGVEGDEAQSKPISVDAEGYRERRAESLVELAHRLAEKARRSGKPVPAAPMSAADRRVMHLALADVPGLTTRSEGEGPARHLVIIPSRDGGERRAAAAGARTEPPAPERTPSDDEVI